MPSSNPQPDPGRGRRDDFERRCRPAGSVALVRRRDAADGDAPDADDPAGGASPGGTAAPAGERIAGHAAVFDTWTVLYSGKYYEWREIIRPGAFKNALLEKQDVRALFNHDADWILGRTKSGTCSLAEDAEGLAFDCDAPQTQLVEELVRVPMRRGDLDQCSFAFNVRTGGEKVTITEDANGRVVEERELLDLDLYDVSVVTYPAYEAATCALAERGRRREEEVRAAKSAGRNRAADRKRSMALRLMP